jgi:hypothetical protein
MKIYKLLFLIPSLVILLPVTLYCSDYPGANQSITKNIPILEQDKDYKENDCLHYATKKCSELPNTIWHKVLQVNFEYNDFKQSHAFCVWELGNQVIVLDRKGSSETQMYKTAKPEGIAFSGLLARGIAKLGIVISGAKFLDDVIINDKVVLTSAGGTK